MHGALLLPLLQLSVSRDAPCVLSQPASSCTTRPAHLGPGGRELFIAGVGPSAGSFGIGKSCLERYPTEDVIGGFRGGEWGVAGLSKVGCEE